MECKWILNENDIVIQLLWLHAVICSKNMCWNCILKLFVDNCYFVSQLTNQPPLSFRSQFWVIVKNNQIVDFSTPQRDYVNDFSLVLFNFPLSLPFPLFIHLTLDALIVITAIIHTTHYDFQFLYCYLEIKYQLSDTTMMTSCMYISHLHKIVLLIYWRCLMSYIVVNAVRRGGWYCSILCCLINAHKIYQLIYIAIHMFGWLTG